MVSIKSKLKKSTNRRSVKTSKGTIDRNKLIIVHKNNSKGKSLYKTIKSAETHIMPSSTMRKNIIIGNREYVPTIITYVIEN